MSSVAVGDDAVVLWSQITALSCTLHEKTGGRMVRLAVQGDPKKHATYKNAYNFYSWWLINCIKLFGLH